MHQRGVQPAVPAVVGAHPDALLLALNLRALVGHLEDVSHLERDGLLDGVLLVVHPSKLSHAPEAVDLLSLAV